MYVGMKMTRLMEKQRVHYECHFVFAIRIRISQQLFQIFPGNRTWSSCQLLSAPVHERYFHVLETFVNTFKSCGGFRVTNWSFSWTGLSTPWPSLYVARQNGNVLKQRKYPQLERIFIVDVDLKSKHLEIGAPGMCNLVIPHLRSVLYMKTTVFIAKKVGIELEERLTFGIVNILG